MFPPGKGINRRNESTGHLNFSFLWSTDDNTQYCFPSVVLIKTVQIPNLILFPQKNQKLLTKQFFSS